MRALTLALSVLFAQTTSDAALEIDKNCAQYAETHVLVRNDVLARLDAAEQNLPKAEAALRQAQDDLQALKRAADELQNQKKLLEQHITMLEGAFKAQQAVCAATAPTVTDDIQRMAANAWETVDMPLGFAAGAGMCIGLAWGLNQVQQ